jgi:hypothetical protein
MLAARQFSPGGGNSVIVLSFMPPAAGSPQRRGACVPPTQTGLSYPALVGKLIELFLAT